MKDEERGFKLPRPQGSGLNVPISDGRSRNLESETHVKPRRGPGVLTAIKGDIHSVFERDPAARSMLEVLLCYPGLHAVWAHCVTHWLWTHKLKLLARWLSQIARGVTGIEIHPGAVIGPGLFIDHGMGVVIGETAEIGANVTLYHGVTLGGTSIVKGKRHPTLGDRVVVGAGAKVLGAITVGEDSRIGANAVVVRPVPPNSVVVGVPGNAVMRTQARVAGDTPDLEHNRMPDMIGASVISLMSRVDALEQLVVGHTHISEPGHLPKEGVWDVEDYTI
ncbi:MAG: serine O-acetyltransferase [Chloroflexi bacterium]|nr:serine O-acetyltransferase [Chloroflexota bacterium]